jgi:hypothetical protein
LSEDDAEQTETGLLAEIVARSGPAPDDPGWYAGHLINVARTTAVPQDPVPAVAENELISAGAATIRRQFVEPFAAFAFGRLGIRSMPPFTNGLAASLRGTLIHDALHGLYADLPAKNEIDSWDATELDTRITSALQKSFWRHERHADRVLKQLFQLEQHRITNLLRSVVALDRERDEFAIAVVEGPFETSISGVMIRGRIDRVDRLDDGAVVLLDYKTGMRKSFLNSDGEPRDMQLVVYACAMTDPVAGLGLVNIDSRSTDIDGAGWALTPDVDWDDVLARWKSEVEDAVIEIQHGDVRINGLQNTQAARPLSLLSRIGELRRDA